MMDTDKADDIPETRRITACTQAVVILRNTILQVIRNSIKSMGPIIGQNNAQFTQAVTYKMQTGLFIQGWLL